MQRLGSLCTCSSTLLPVEPRFMEKGRVMIILLSRPGTWVRIEFISSYVTAIPTSLTGKRPRTLNLCVFLYDITLFYWEGNQVYNCINVFMWSVLSICKYKHLENRQKFHTLDLQVIKTEAHFCECAASRQQCLGGTEALQINQTVFWFKGSQIV